MSAEKPGPCEALNAALKYLSYRDRSVKEVRERLRSRGYSHGDISGVVDYLLEAGLLDDERFAAMLAASRLRNKNWGPAKITSELLSKGVSREITKKVLSGFDEDVERDAALRALEKWSRRNRASLKGAGRPEMLKALRHLKARGFSHPLIIKVIESFSRGDENRVF